ncbi:glycerate kinase [Paenibacillus sp. PL91]|uniref:glycerate kinase n=1 Tax=Paenibacillus sp. PL91 TaxID=2729538 RepID=UPI00145ED1C9|nr:glycerate kinase [Paenibacillus sp. PL91]MBC9199896.1 glycerate kinase [Paenibacillus sp. PL91]
MKVVLAPDSFKGSRSAVQIANRMEEGIRIVYPDADIVKLPMADGGEGTMEIIVQATCGEFITVPVHDPLGRIIQARYGITGDGRTAVIELAEASGLALLQGDEKAPLIASTYGTGELIRHAIRAGYRQFIVCLGGSATNDGGAGMLQALGMSLMDEGGAELQRGGVHLSKLVYIDDSEFESGIRESTFIIASDVRNPLCGENGASAVYGPQKGAKQDEVKLLDHALLHYADLVCKHTGVDVSCLPGSGAAGGTGASLLAFFDATMQAGARLVMDTISFDEHIRDADWIITGEGRLDGQTGSGKVVEAVCVAAARQHIPVIAVCGSVEANAAYTAKLGLCACFSLVPGPCSVEEAIARTDEWMRERMIHIFSLLRTNKG